jgi:hypothetical protein
VFGAVVPCGQTPDHGVGEDTYMRTNSGGLLAPLRS